jgi:two-component system NtrC family sensor kinase
MLEGLATGADDYIQKSAEIDVLKARVRAQLRRRQFEDENRKVRERLLKSEIEASEARAARALAETRATLVEELEQRNQALANAYAELQSTQSQLVQAAKMASLGSLVAGVAHEVNNPLAFVLSHLRTTESSLLEVESLIGAETLDPALESWSRARSRLNSMRMGLERIRDLVVKLRTFSRLDEGEIKTVKMSECIDSVLRILEHRLEGRIEITKEFHPPEELECMPGLLNQAIMNLVANALDAIEGPGTIVIFAGGEGKDYVIRIEDSGPGIPAASRLRILEPFYTTKDVGSGTGLGLSITDSIVKKHGGTLEFGDAPRGGAAAWIRLPMEQAIGSSPAKHQTLGRV